MNRRDVSPAIVLQAVAFHRAQSTSRIDTAERVDSIVDDGNGETSSLVVHRRNSHPNIETRIVSHNAVDSCVSALVEEILATKNVKEVVEDCNGVGTETFMHWRQEVGFGDVRCQGKKLV